MPLWGHDGPSAGTGTDDCPSAGNGSVPICGAGKFPFNEFRLGVPLHSLKEYLRSVKPPFSSCGLLIIHSSHFISEQNIDESGVI